MKVTVKLTNLELSNMQIGEKGADGLNPIAFELTTGSIPNVPKNATQVFMQGNMTVAYIPVIHYAKIESIQDAIDAIQQIQTYIDDTEDGERDYEPAAEFLEEAKMHMKAKE